MEAFLVIIVASLLDPIRWIICILAAWFIRNYIGALIVGVSVTVTLAAMFFNNPSGLHLLLGAFASAIIVSIFYFWRKSRREKAVRASM